MLVQGAYRMTYPSEDHDSLRKDPGSRPLRDSAAIFDKFAIGLPERVRRLAIQDDQALALSPGPCSTEHTLQAALVSIQSTARSSPTLVDPTFLDGRAPGDS